MKEPQKCDGSGHDKKIEYCCSEEYPCFEGEGDCDVDKDCQGELVCGTNNCNPDAFSPNWADCCEEGECKKEWFNTYTFPYNCGQSI